MIKSTLHSHASGCQEVGRVPLIRMSTTSEVFIGRSSYTVLLFRIHPTHNVLRHPSLSLHQTLPPLLIFHTIIIPFDEYR